MMPRRSHVFLTFVPPLLLAGCAWFYPRGSKAVQAPHPTLIGTVASVNEDYHFVLIDTYYNPRSGTALKALSPDGTETGVLTVSPEKRPPFIIANIVHGSPQRGDQVFE